MCPRRPVEDTDRALRRNDRAGRMTTSLNVHYLDLVLMSNSNLKLQNILPPSREDAVEELHIHTAQPVRKR